MDLDSQEGKPSRRKVIQRQNQEIKALKEEWKKAIASCNKKGAKKELDKEYNSKIESLQLSHEMELLKLSGENCTESKGDLVTPFDEKNNNNDKHILFEKFQNSDEIPSLYSNASFQMVKSEKRKKKKQKELEQKYMKNLEECALNSKFILYNIE